MMIIDFDKKEFAERLAALRMDKGVSARDMSLSIGQSPNYINNIENARGYPSMQMFLYICEYLEVTPKEFFDSDSVAPVKTKELLNAVKGLSSEQLSNLIELAKGLSRNK